MTYVPRKIRVFYENGDLSSYLQEMQESLKKAFLRNQKIIY
jgi:hypothetical protein